MKKPDENAEPDPRTDRDTAHITPQRAVDGAIAWAEKTDKPAQNIRVCLTCARRTLHPTAQDRDDPPVFCDCTPNCPQLIPLPNAIEHVNGD